MSLARVARQQVAELGHMVGTTPENLAAIKLHRWGHADFRQQYRILSYRLDFAWPALRLAIEVDGPHHQRPDVAARDAYRDERLRDEGWTVLRVNAGPVLDRHLSEASRIVHLLKGAS